MHIDEWYWRYFVATWQTGQSLRPRQELGMETVDKLLKKAQQEKTHSVLLPHGLHSLGPQVRAHLEELLIAR